MACFTQCYSKLKSITSRFKNLKIQVNLVTVKQRKCTRGYDNVALNKYIVISLKKDLIHFDKTFSTML